MDDVPVIEMPGTLPVQLAALEKNRVFYLAGVVAR
jgi:hypothetical protein